MRTVGLSLVVLLLGLVMGAGAASAQPRFEFKLGFKALADQIPSVVGEPLENEQHNPENGDTLQRTTAGMMVWRKADNWTAFTDGFRTWINGPVGVEARLNDQRFKWEGGSLASGSVPSAAAVRSDSVLSDNLLVTWYGNPNTGLMGVLGQFTGADLAARLQRQANAYAPFTNKRIMPAYHLIAVVAQAGAGSDGLWRRREDRAIIDSMLQQARAAGFKLILDIQVGHSTVQDELEFLRPYLEQPDVYLALDPEFDMWEGQAPGQEIGHTTAASVNYALGFLESLIKAKGLPPKVLIVHQFTLNMLPDKENIGRSAVVDLVLDMDGFGSQPLKLDTYRAVMAQPLEFPGVKLFYDQDPGLFTPEQVMGLDPTPAVVIYQ